MSFTSLIFLCLVAVSLVVYYSIPGKVRWVVLLAADYVFYIYSGTAMAGYLVAATAVTFIAGLWLERLNAKKAAMPKSELKKKKKTVAAAALIFNFGMLYILKYLSGTAAFISHITGLELPEFSLAIPLGVSYYIFQSCGYVIDCYRGRYKAEHNFFKYALFVSFFPQMIQGPISRHRDLGKQLTEPHEFDYENIRSGIQLMLWGYFKKLVIADRAGVLVNTVFGDYNNYTGSIIITAVIFYCIQLYCDFSGGIDIARGTAQLFGINLTENFKRPLFADSVADYWRRWHITLGSWMRDYVFYPISLSKPFTRLGKFSRKKFGGIFGKILTTSLATFIVYLIIGIWHGSSIKYIAFGLWNGSIITASLLLEPAFVKICARLGIDRESSGWHIFRIMRTAIIVFLGRYMTRAASFLSAIAMLKASFTSFGAHALLDGTLMQLGMTKMDFMVVAAGVVGMLIVEAFQERGVRIRMTLAQKSRNVQFIGMLVPCLVVIVFGIWIKGDITAGFIYMQF